jgi:hypothetical protein
VAVEVVQLEMFQVYLLQMEQVAQVAEDQEEDTIQVILQDLMSEVAVQTSEEEEVVTLLGQVEQPIKQEQVAQVLL